MNRKIIIFKQMVIPFAVLSILIVRDYAIKELSKKTFGILFQLKIINFIMYLICGIFISEIIRISLKYRDRLSLTVVVFNIIVLLLIYRFTPLGFLHNQNFQYTNLLLIGCHIYMAFILFKKER
ncbi:MULTISPECIES: hypothetical protein [unclassified Clostridium]|uniref:hypothetical protein n=1 Tax=unclassified Clostridium TaxID=2614128 RepID=UPI0011074DF3|nr:MULTISPECIES: hypothetical protein [unclassified Clostridium]